MYEIEPVSEEISPIQPNGEVIVVDGLDGAGKGTLIETLAEQLPGTTLLIEFPNYELPWGRVLRNLLDNGDMDLSLQDRMLIYALNRLETLDSIVEQTRSLMEMGEVVNYVFDRFPTSNVLTLAYYLDKLPTWDYPEPDNFESWVLENYGYMMEIDKTFLETLGLQDFAVYIPMLEVEETLMAISSDQTRERADTYEKDSVQAKAKEIYEILAIHFPQHFHLYRQNLPRESRMSPEEQASYVLSQVEGIPGVPMELDYRHRSTIHKIKPEIQAQSPHVRKLLETYGSDQLRMLDPYQTFSD